MTVLEELKTTQNSVLEKATGVFELANRKTVQLDFETEFIDLLLDALSQTRTVYEYSIIETRRAETREEIAEIWKETYEAYRAMYGLWSGASAILGEPKSKLLTYWGKLIQELEAASREHYEFHA